MNHQYNDLTGALQTSLSAEDFTQERVLQAAADAHLRQNLCSLLTELCEHTRTLVSLMGRNNFVTLLAEQQFSTYQRTMERLSTTSQHISHTLEAAQEMDKVYLLANLLTDKRPQ